MLRLNMQLKDLFPVGLPVKYLKKKTPFFFHSGYLLDLITLTILSKR